MTELDMNRYRHGDDAEDMVLTPETEAAFAAKYGELFGFLTELADEGTLDTVIFWGLHDGVSWLNGFPRKHRNYPLLIGREFALKPAFYEVLSRAEKME